MGYIFGTGEGNNYVINENGYVTWKTGADAAALAQKALAYANNTSNNISNDGNKTVAEGENSVTFDNLSLGYYLVESSVGALCGLTTTDNEVTITEKNGVPSVEKGVSDGNTYTKTNYANIGDEVTFQITIDVKKGAQKYVLHDEMSEGFKLKTPMNNVVNSTLQIYASDNADSPTFYDTLIETTHYTLTTTERSFTVTFKDEYLKTHENVDYKIVVSYIAILTGDATIGNSGNTNNAWLTYGDNSTKSNESETKTYTFGIPVFKYTGTNTALEGAKFSLYSDAECNSIIELIKSGTGETYRRFITGYDNDSKVTEITTTSNGEFNITGLKPGIYYLKEIEAPKGYNKLNNAITVKIEEAADGGASITLYQNSAKVDKIKVENKSGSLLPSTGGMGTTVIYIVGALLVLISGVVLITKKRADLK